MDKILCLLIKNQNKNEIWENELLKLDLFPTSLFVYYYDCINEHKMGCVYKYKSEDDKIFNNEKDCIDHENELKDQIIKDKLKDFFNNNIFRIVNSGYADIVDPIINNKDKLLEILKG